MKRMLFDRARPGAGVLSPREHEEQHYRARHDRLRRLRLRRQCEEQAWWLDEDGDAFDSAREEHEDVRDLAASIS